jgi:hypothetical protein
MSFNPVLESMLRKQALIDSEKTMKESRLIPKNAAAVIIDTDNEGGYLDISLVYPEGVSREEIDLPPAAMAAARALALLEKELFSFVEEDESEQDALDQERDEKLLRDLEELDELDLEEY